ncbi:MAG: GNAT family N-acetyltransferase [Trebonia sp.]|jgi:GNAT superfamily N-acetyltransferase
MSAPGVLLEVADGRRAAVGEAEHIALHDEVFGSDDPGFARRLGVWRRQPGFVLAEARHGGYLVGYACGLPLRPSTDWWRDVTAPLPASTTGEHPGRTFALTQLLVRGSWRRQGIGTELLGLVLDGRDEERATIKLPPTATAAQAVFRNWGWVKVARSRGPSASAPVSDILTRPL